MDRLSKTEVSPFSPRFEEKGEFRSECPLFVRANSVRYAGHQNCSSTTPIATSVAAAQRRERTSSPRMYFARSVSNR